MIGRYQPILSSSKKYSFHESECAIIDGLRTWSREYFQKNLVFDTETRLPKNVEEIVDPDK